MKTLSALILGAACSISLSFIDTVKPAFAATENEPNNSFNTRQVLPTRTNTVDGLLDIPGDVDFFTFSNLRAGSAFLAEITSGTFDSILGFLDDSGKIIDTDDDSGEGLLSLLSGIVPASGNLNLAVTAFADFGLTGNHSRTGAYTLSLSPKKIINGGFETGNFSGWATAGNTSIETSAFGSSPTEGNFQALLSTADPTVPDSFLEQFLGIEAGSLDALGNGNATTGSAIRQIFTANAGDVLTFDWNFLTDEGTPTFFFNDFSFVSLGMVSELADSEFPIFIDSLTPFNEETGYQTFSFTIPTTGTYTLGIGVTDVRDDVVDSGLLIDNVRLSSVPVPESSSVLGILAFSALGAGSLLKRKQYKKAIF